MSRAGKTSSIEAEIERNLKRAYEDVAQQELPSRFTDLLAQLKDADAKTARNTDAASEASDDA